MTTKLELIKEIYQLDDNDLQKRKEALEKIVPYADAIMDKFYEKILQKEELARFIPTERIEELKAKQIRFVADLLSKPFDETLYKRIARVGIVHYHIDLDPVSMSYGYHVLSELILEQSQRDPSLLPYLKLIIKYLKVAETIMGQEYFAQKTLAESPYRANDLFIAVNDLHMAYIGCRESFEKLSVDEEAKAAFEERLDALKPYRQVLSEAGFNLATIKRFCTEYANEPSETNKEALRRAIERPMNDLSVTAYLSLASSLAMLRTMTDIIYRRRVTNEQGLTRQKVRQNIQTMLGENFGWAIERLDFKESEPEEGYDIVKHMSFQNEVFYLCLKVRDIANRLYVVESVDLLAEAMKLTLYLRAKAMEACELPDPKRQ